MLYWWIFVKRIDRCPRMIITFAKSLWSLEWFFDSWEGEGNGIVSCGWLHNGIKHEIQIDKVIPAPGSEPATLSEKITRQNYCPSLVELGGCPISGVFGITSHGEFVLKVFNEFEPTKSTLVKVAFCSNVNPLYLWFSEIIDVTSVELFSCWLFLQSKWNNINRPIRRHYQ